MIPKEYLGRYLLYGSRNDYFETTSSNAIISSTSAVENKTYFIVLDDTNFSYHYSDNGKAIRYKATNHEPNYYFLFFTNRTSQRAAVINWSGFSGTPYDFIHANDINK